MKIENLYKIRTFFLKYRKKAGFICLFLAVFSMLMVRFTSLDSIFFNMFFVFLFSAIFLLPEYQTARQRKLFDYDNPRSPFFIDRFTRR